MHSADTMHEPPTESPSGMAVSFCFWLTLLFAVSIFAAVSLSPKVAVYLTLESQFRSQQFELKQLEQQQAELERVIAALKEDPHFAAELTRLEFDAVRPGEEILNVDSSLSLDPNARNLPTISAQKQISPWQPWVEVLAYHQKTRTFLLVSAAGLVLFAFGWLQDATPQIDEVVN